MTDTSPSDNTNKTYVSDQTVGCVVILILGPHACCAERSMKPRPLLMGPRVPDKHPDTSRMRCNGDAVMVVLNRCLLFVRLVLSLIALLPESIWRITRHG